MKSQHLPYNFRGAVRRDGDAICVLRICLDKKGQPAWRAGGRLNWTGWYVLIVKMLKGLKAGALIFRGNAGK